MTPTNGASLAQPSAPGLYFTFYNASTQYYMWFQITNESDPAPGGTGIKVNITAAYTTQDVANAIVNAMNREQSAVFTVSSLPTNQSYFTFSANPASAAAYFVWYQVASSSSAPVVAGTGIQVTLIGTETNAQVVAKTLIAINAYQYAVPDLRGMFLRGSDPLGTWDVDNAIRWSTVIGISGGNLGTFEYAAFQKHLHTSGTIASANPTGTGTLPGKLQGYYADGAAHSAYTSDTTGGVAIGTVTLSLTAGAISGATAVTGGTETRPVNAAVNWFINY